MRIYRGLRYAQHDNNFKNFGKHAKIDLDLKDENLKFCQ